MGYEHKIIKSTSPIKFIIAQLAICDPKSSFHQTHILRIIYVDMDFQMNKLHMSCIIIQGVISWMFLFCGMICCVVTMHHFLSMKCYKWYIWIFYFHEPISCGDLILKLNQNQLDIFHTEMV